MNPNVKKITESNIQFTKEFKLKAIKSYQSGQSADEIFLKAGIDIFDFEPGYARKSIIRWKEASEEYGSKNLDNERRGQSRAKKFKTMEEELEYLRAENDFLKKLNALEAAFLKKKNTK
jgi:transposase-like protein